MGIYGGFAKRLVENQEKQFANLAEQVTIEIYINSSLYKQLLEENLNQILQENVLAKVNLSKNNKKIQVVIRDKKTMNRGGEVGQHSCSIKVTKPTTVMGRGVDILIPDKGKDVYVDPKVDAKIKKNKSYPEEINIALDFAKTYQKNLGLIYNNPENTYNQYKLLDEIISKCDYISSIDITGDTLEIKNKIIDKFNKKKEESKQ